MTRKVSINRNASTGRTMVTPDKRDFRGGFQPKSKPTSGLTSPPSLPKSSSAVKSRRKP